MRDLLLIVIVIALGVGGWFLLQRQYIPSTPVALAREFIGALNDRNLAKAFGMTTKVSLCGRSEAEFQRFAEQQLLGRLGSGTIADVTILGVIPLQTWGNRIRRRFLGREVDPRQCNVDHLLVLSGSRTGSIPFDVRLIRNASDCWEVTFFQSHAM